MIDNSLGSSFLTKKSIGYFTNENIEKSIYKFAVNVFENAFFSYTTSINMVRNSAIYTASIAAVLCISAVLGIKDVWLFAIKIPVIAILVLEFSRLCYFVTRTHRVYESFIQFFNSLEGKTILSDAENACALKNILDYETLITWWGFHLDSSIFNSSNPELSKDWIKIKKNLKIPIT